jgi:hypothetical protein
LKENLGKPLITTTTTKTPRIYVSWETTEKGCMDAEGRVNVGTIIRTKGSSRVRMLGRKYTNEFVVRTERKISQSRLTQQFHLGEESSY